MDKDIRKYWDEQALKFQNSSLATSPDSIAFEMEIQTLLRYLDPKDKICDVGCGNAQKAKSIATHLECDYTGVDFSDQMIKAANLVRLELLKQNPGLKIKFKQADILQENLFEEQSFDKVISTRCLINLSNFDAQKRAIKNIASFLKKDGIFLCIENTLEALDNLNEIRANFQLEPIKVRWHNCYFKEKELLEFLKEDFVCEKIDNFASTYYLISRTLNALMGEEVDYNSKLNFLSAKLPAIGDYSPMKCFVLRKRVRGGGALPFYNFNSLFLQKVG